MLVFQEGGVNLKKTCPKCHRDYTELENYCTKCGIELQKAPNRCSANKTAHCASRIYADDDIYCAYCGELTVYALERQVGSMRNSG